MDVRDQRDLLNYLSGGLSVLTFSYTAYFVILLIYYILCGLKNGEVIVLAIIAKTIGYSFFLTIVTMLVPSLLKPVMPFLVGGLLMLSHVVNNK